MKKTRLISLFSLIAITLGVGGCSSSEDLEIANANLTPNPTYAASEEEVEYVKKENTEDLECEHDFGDTYTIDEDDSRFHVQTCSLCGYKQREVHQVETEEGNCIHCEATGLNTAGLTYTLHSSAYYVSDYDMTLPAKELYVPSTYQGLPVTAIGEGGDSVASMAFEGDSTGTIANKLQFVSLPDGITRISNYAFSYCYSLQYINIPEGVTYIGNYAFAYCTALKSVVLPDSLLSLGGHCFLFCTALKEANIPDRITSIPSNAFSSCESLERIILPETCTSISSYAFEYCTSLQEVYLPDGFTSFGQGAFRGCVGLEYINVPDSLTTISHYTFEYCCSIKTINVPYGVTTIGYELFDDCSSLEYIVLPETCTVIRDFAFWQDFSLQYIVFPKSITTVGGDAFGFCYSLSHVFYTGTESEWNNVKFTKPYNEYIQNANIYYLDDDGSLKTEDPNGNYWHYDEEGEIAIW